MILLKKLKLLELVSEINFIRFCDKLAQYYKNVYNQMKMGSCVHVSPKVQTDKETDYNE